MENLKQFIADHAEIKLITDDNSVKISLFIDNEHILSSNKIYISNAYNNKIKVYNKKYKPALIVG